MKTVLVSEDMSGACYRVTFYDLWEFNAMDALIIYDYKKVFAKAIGYDYDKDRTVG